MRSHREILRLIDPLIRPIKQRVMMAIARGVLDSLDDGAGIQLTKATFLKDETLNLERVQNHGFTSSPPAGSEVVAVFVGGNREHGFILAAEKRGEKPATAAGEAAMYSATDSYIAARDGGKFEVKNSSGELLTKLEAAVTSLIGEPFIVNKGPLTALKALLDSMKV